VDRKVVLRGCYGPSQLEIGFVFGRQRRQGVDLDGIGVDDGEGEAGGG
jgi:hypothetical protein